MTAKDLIRTLLRTNDFIVNAYLADLEDADLLRRPTPGANHIAWQLGHLINSEQSLLKTAAPFVAPIELPAGWEKQYNADAARSDSTAGYVGKAQYLDIYKRSRANLLSVLEKFPDADFDKRTEGRLAQVAPTIGDLFVLIANHPMMHVGQWAVVRRLLGKPIVI